MNTAQAGGACTLVAGAQRQQVGVGSCVTSNRPLSLKSLRENMMPSAILARPARSQQQRTQHFSRERRRRATVPRLLHRPIIGDIFGAGRFALATRPRIAHGLHAVDYLVIEPRRGQVLAMAGDKGTALAQARALIADAERQSLLWPELRALQPAQPRMPSRRRREVFQRSRGRCHYCSTPLQLAGPWHADHQQPRALDGADDALNLVASCVACNLTKGARTALEFIGADSPNPGTSADLRQAGCGGGGTPPAPDHNVQPEGTRTSWLPKM